MWTEPRAPRPPARLRRDWVLVVVFTAAAIVESFLRRDLPWVLVSATQAVVLTFTLPWRRTRPLAMLVLALGVSGVVYIASVGGHAGGPVVLASMVYVLLLVHTVFRWGSGREAVAGSSIVLVTYGVSTAVDHVPIGDTVFGLVALVLPAALGASRRLWATSRLRKLDRVRLREREQLARELHDTVAHHVSAMVIRAQAGRVVARSRPGAALEALAIVEEEGSRTLFEMRTMVSALREADLAPQRGTVDIERLARADGDEPLVDVHLSGDLQVLSPSVGAAAYRIAQESVTNAMRCGTRGTPAGSSSWSPESGKASG